MGSKAVAAWLWLIDIAILTGSFQPIAVLLAIASAMLPACKGVDLISNRPTLNGAANEGDFEASWWHA